MNKIMGFVLVKETNIGIPNLVVTIYDSEKEMGDIIPDLANKEDKRNPTIALKTERLGRRMGSCLTNKDGKFVLESKELQFEGNESRPDLLLIVFAPEDIQDEKDPFPRPLPPEKRILYISTVPRTDVGAEEAYIIRLLQSQLSRYQIPSSLASNHGESESIRLSNAVENIYSFRDNIKERLNPRIKKDYERAKVFKEKAKEKFRNFSAVPKIQRKHPEYLANPEDLWEKQREVIDKGLKRLEEYKPELTLTLTDKELESLQVKSKDGKVLGVDPSLLSAMIKDKMGGVDLVRVRDVKRPLLSPEALLKKYTLNDDNRPEVVVP